MMRATTLRVGLSAGIALMVISGATACSKSNPQPVATDATSTTAASSEGNDGTSSSKGSTKPKTATTKKRKSAQTKSFDLGQGEYGKDGSDPTTAEVSCAGTKKTFVAELKGDDGSSLTIFVDDPSMGAKNSVQFVTEGGDQVDGDGEVATKFTDANGRSSAGFTVIANLEVDGKDYPLFGQGACVIEGSSTGKSTGKSTTSTRPSSSSASSSLALPVTDAAAFASTMVKVALGAKDQSEEAIHAAWEDAGLPATASQGYALEATPQKVSGFATVGSKKSGTQILPFAVKDTSGKCAIGYLYYVEAEKKLAGKVKTSTTDLPACTGQAAFDAYEADDDL